MTARSNIGILVAAVLFLAMVATFSLYHIGDVLSFDPANLRRMR
jgi:hypothetical protein